MKIIFKCAIALIIVFSLSVFIIRENRSVKPFSQLTVDNIEALADNEGGTDAYFCMGDGDIDCFGYKVALKITHIR
jgi:hypothetical protein